MDYGWMVPILTGIMLYMKKDRIASLEKQIEWKGLAIVIAGIIIFLIGHRVIQQRISVFSLPIIIWGSVWFLAGKKTALVCTFPILFLWTDIPLLSFTSITIHLQMIATEATHLLSSLLGIETIVKGTNIFSANGEWDAYSVTGGCSGMRSLIALILISVAWAYVSDMSNVKKLLFVCASIPMAVLGNIFRLTSIFFFAEYVNPAFASQTWHDWSGLLFFFPFSLAGLAITHTLIRGSFNLNGLRKKTVIKKNTTSSL